MGRNGDTEIGKIKAKASVPVMRYISIAECEIQLSYSVIG